MKNPAPALGEDGKALYSCGSQLGGAPTGGVGGSDNEDNEKGEVSQAMAELTLVRSCPTRRVWLRF